MTTRNETRDRNKYNRVYDGGGLLFLLHNDKRFCTMLSKQYSIFVTYHLFYSKLVGKQKTAHLFVFSIEFKKYLQTVVRLIYYTIRNK